MPEEAGSGSNISLIKAFKNKANIRQADNKNLVQTFSTISSHITPSNVARFGNYLKTNMTESDETEYKTNPILLELINHPDSTTLVSVIKKIKNNPYPATEYNQLVSELREIKTKDELALLRKSIAVSAVAHAEVMKAIQPSMSERELK
ncbi:MAG: hypothetical protein WKG06_20155 [Segetibacter sp.]